MKINFDSIEQKSMPNFKGGKLSYDARIFDDGLNKIMQGQLMPGASIGMHTHTDSSEIIFVTEGIGSIVSPDGAETLAAGDCHYCPKGHAHSLENNSDSPLRFLAIVPQQP